MASIDQQNGITVNLPDSLKLEKTAQSKRSGRRTTALPTGPIPVNDDKTAGTAEQAALLEALSQQGLIVAGEFAAFPAPDAVSRLRSEAGSGQSEEISIQVDLSAGEEAVVLSERNGYYAWHFSQNKEVFPASSTRRGKTAGPVRRATFKIELRPLPIPGDMARQRGVIGEFLFESVKTYVLKFVARAALGNAMKYLERHVQKGFVVVKADAPEKWRRIETLSALRLPIDRPVRILLFIHGTFSSTVGSYGALSLTPWGKTFLKSTQENYDALIGYDHPTLSEDPFENATDLLQRLSMDTASPIRIDAVCFSRGALVYRSLVERLLPEAGLNAQLGPAIFAASTNGGTRLAEPGNWHDLADLYTNLAVGTVRALQMIAPAQPFTVVLGEVIKSLGALIKYMATAAVSERRVPGLAAMEPDGDFIRSINQTQPGQVEPAVADYFAIISDFKARLIGGEHEPKELPARLVLKLADGFVDRLMGGNNDLVVNTDSMIAIDALVGGFVKDVFDFGENSAVYHTNYFTRPETANALARWLRLPQPGVAYRGARRTAEPPSASVPIAPGGLVTPDIPAAVDIDFTIVNANDRVKDVVATIINERPSYIVINRNYQNEILNYAFPAEELLDRSNNLALHDTIGSMLDLRESDAEPALSPSQAAGRPTTARRNARVVLEAGQPVGVVPGSDDLPSSDRLGEVAARVVTPKTARDGILVRRSMPTFTANPPKTSSMAESKKAICHFHAEMDDEVVLQRVTTVEVIVSREAIERAVGPTAAQSTTGVATDPERNITIQVIPRAHCEIVGEDRVEVQMPAVGNPHYLYFDVRPTHLGEGAVWVLARQGQVPLVTLALAPQIVQQRTGPTRHTRAEAVTREAAPLQRPLHQLRITEQFRGDESFYEYEIQSPGLGLLNRFQSKQFKGQRSQYIDNLYREIETRWLESGQDIEAFQSDLRAFGGSLFDELIPQELQRQLWKHRQEIDSIMVISTEPFIPWELVHLKDPDARGMPEETLFLGQIGLVRWLHGSWPPDRLHLGKVRYVIPDYPDKRYLLPETAEEKKFLEQRLHATAVEPQPLAVRDLLKQPGAFDLLHFACHGAAEHGDIANARLMLQGRVENHQYVPAYLNATTVENYSNLQAVDGARPMVVLNACQSGKVGFKLTGLGGFSQAFLKNGAGAFVGTLWSVGDFPARTFTEKFYTEMLNHKTLAEAAIEAREAARQAGEATWLAYAVYGHPHAMVK